jgi:DNA polymerase-3 subunit epsilon
MRHLILDTETTGLDPKDHRIIEIGAIELIDRRPTGRNVHFYVNPDREIDAGATDVHGLSWEMLRDKPKFAEIADEFITFARGAQWVIHNAPFDVAFLDEEFARLGMSSSAAIAGEVVDTLALAREQFPGKRNNLDALCERFGVANAQRTLHGALLDAQLLAEVYLAMTRGQESLTIDIVTPRAEAGEGLAAAGPLELILLLASAEELAAHLAYLAELDRDAKGACVWLALSAAGDGAFGNMAVI